MKLKSITQAAIAAFLMLALSGCETLGKMGEWAGIGVVELPTTQIAEVAITSRALFDETSEATAEFKKSLSPRKLHKYNKNRAKIDELITAMEGVVETHGAGGMAKVPRAKALQLYGQAKIAWTRIQLTWATDIKDEATRKELGVLAFEISDVETEIGKALINDTALGPKIARLMAVVSRATRAVLLYKSGGLGALAAGVSP